jgi:hypothetical protein
MKVYLLVFDDGSDPDINLRGFVDSLDNGAEIITLDGHVCFLKSTLSAVQLSEKFLKFAGSSLYFITDLSSADYAGRMQGVFWDFLKEPSLPVAFESAAE